MLAASLAASIPAPPARNVSIGPLDIRLYAIALLAGIAAATWLTMRRWRARGGNPDLVLETALWAVAGGLVGGRLYHVVTSWDQLGDEWYAPFAIWEGGLGIWGAVAGGVLAGAIVVRRRGESVAAMLDAVAPGLLVAQAIGRLGNYFNQELYGRATDLPWALEVDPGRRPIGMEDVATFHPTFLYEGLWNLAGAALLIWLGSRWRIIPPGVFFLYVAWYSFARLFLEQLRVDPSQELLGLRLNFYVALALLLAALAAYVWSQRRTPLSPPPAEPRLPRRAGGARVRTERRPRG